MQLAAAHQAAGDVSCLERGPFGRRMGRKIAGDGNQDMPALVGVTPKGDLSDSCFEHLIGMEPGVLAEHRQRKRGDAGRFLCPVGTGAL